MRVRSTLGPSTAALAATLAAALLVGCGNGGGAAPSASASALPFGLTEEQAARVLVRVGEETITLGDYAAALDRMDPFDRLRYQSPEKRRELLKEMIDLELLAVEAKRRGLDQRPEAQEAARQVLRDALLSEVHRSLPAPASIPIDEVRAYYEEHREEYREPERRRVSVIALDDEAKAKSALEEAVKSPDATTWGTLVKERSLFAASEKTSKLPLDLAGDLGIVGPPADAKGANPKVPQPVREAVFAIAEVGGVHPELVRHEGKLYVVRLAGKTAAHERSVEEADRQIRVELLKRKQAELETKLEAELRAKYKVEIDEAALGRVSTAGIALPRTASATATGSAVPPPPSAVPAAAGSAKAP
jgi:peptidyl-prolyl cis-trans isomerase C